MKKQQFVKKYSEWAEHPRWKELENLCSEIERLKRKAKELRVLIKYEVYGDDDD